MMEIIIPLLFVLAFVLPGDIYYFLVTMKKIPSCKAEADEKKGDKRMMIASNIIAVIAIVIILALVL